jgi:hypothetical protein
MHALHALPEMLSLPHQAFQLEDPAQGLLAVEQLLSK